MHDVTAQVLLQATVPTRLPSSREVNVTYIPNLSFPELPKHPAWFPTTVVLNMRLLSTKSSQLLQAVLGHTVGKDCVVSGREVWTGV